MRGRDERCGGLFSYVDLEARVPADHPLRAIRVLVDEALDALSADFGRLYSRTGRPSIAPEKLLRALLLQAFYTIRGSRMADAFPRPSAGPIASAAAGAARPAGRPASASVAATPRPPRAGRCASRAGKTGARRSATATGIAGPPASASSAQPRRPAGKPIANPAPTSARSGGGATRG